MSFVLQVKQLHSTPTVDWTLANGAHCDIYFLRIKWPHLSACMSPAPSHYNKARLPQEHLMADLTSDTAAGRWMNEWMKERSGTVYSELGRAYVQTQITICKLLNWHLFFFASAWQQNQIMEKKKSERFVIIFLFEGLQTWALYGKSCLQTRLWCTGECLTGLTGPLSAALNSDPLHSCHLFECCR